MTARIADDKDWIGRAILEIDREREGGLAVSLQFPDKTYLGPEGSRSRKRHLFEAEPCCEGACRRFRLGPAVTAHVREAEIVTLADAAGGSLGSLVWEGIRAPPEAGAGAPIGPAPRNAPKGAQTTRTVVGEPTGPRKTPPASTDGRPPPPPPLPVEETTITPIRRRRLLPALAGLVVLLVAAAVAAVLAGLVGWQLQPNEVRFVGPAGGPFQPSAQEAQLVRAWWVRPMVVLFGETSPLDARGRPAWLDLQARSGEGGWVFHLAANSEATRDLPPSVTSTELPLDFPLRRQVVPGLRVTLTITALTEPPPARPASSTPPPRPPAVSSRPQPPPPQARSTVDDVACDRLAGNRYDPDHPADRGFKDDIFDLSTEEADAGLASCDPRPDRDGPDRRFAVQRGRLLADRAMRKLKAGDVDGATRDMDEAVAIWKHGDARGSAYAANLLGAYYKGTTFNRPPHLFVAADERLATEYWERGMRGGSIVAQRNFAAQLLMGRGVAADPSRALALLQEALAKGDIRAAGILGVAFFSGAPAGVPLDKARGWSFILQAQCVDRDAATLLTREIASGARPATDRRACP